MNAPAVDNTLDPLYRQASEALGTTGMDAAGATAGHVYDSFTRAAATLDHAAYYGVLPLCFAILILTENFRSQTEGSPFRVGQVVGRLVAVVALLLAYGWVCRLITGLAGAGSGWMSTDQLGGIVGIASKGLKAYWDAKTGDNTYIWEDAAAVPGFLAVLFIWLILVIAAFFAYVVGLLLSLAQAALLSILLAAGKTCISVSLLPGVTLGKSWARLLAQVAAWSTIAGIITKLLIAKTGGISIAMSQGDLVFVLRVAAQFVILGVCTIYIPKITAAIFSGAASHAPGVLGAIAIGTLGARAAWQRATGSGAKRTDRAREAQGGEGFAPRPHKRPFPERAPIGAPRREPPASPIGAPVATAPPPSARIAVPLADPAPRPPAHIDDVPGLSRPGLAAEAAEAAVPPERVATALRKERRQPPPPPVPRIAKPRPTSVAGEIDAAGGPPPARARAARLVETPTPPSSLPVPVEAMPPWQVSDVHPRVVRRTVKPPDTPSSLTDKKENA